MTTTVQHETGEPIIRFQFDDSSSEQSVIDAYTSSMALAMSAMGPVYRIIDVRRAVSSYANIVETVRSLVQGMSGAAVAPQMLVAFVGTATMSVKGVTFFATPEDALAEARSYVAETVMSL